MLLSRQDYINFLINEARTNCIKIDSTFYNELTLFIKSRKGAEGLNLFQRLDPNKVGVTTSHITDSFTRIFGK